MPFRQCPFGHKCALGRIAEVRRGRRA
ncbi:MAG: hypothetical protein OXFUSZZB_000174, partial [Candidatus Fervidibacter sp.]